LRSRPSGEQLVPHIPFTFISKQNSPTLWPLPPEDKTPMEIAIEAGEQENRALKSLIVSLSEMILKDVTSKR
jgi:hypothetical protein